MQNELLLVIATLEDFADAVIEKLDTVDLATKRRIVLGLVKRFEIHKDEIVVVFRVDPQPHGLADENSNDLADGVKSMQHCTRRTFAAAGQRAARRGGQGAGHVQATGSGTDASLRRPRHAAGRGQAAFLHDGLESIFNEEAPL